MSQSTICYDPPTQLVKNTRTVYKINRGIAVIPATIKVLDLKINPVDAAGNPATCYFPALSGIWSAVSQIELKVNDKPVDLFLSKQASAFINSLGNPDMQNDITSQLTGSSNNVYESVDDESQQLLYKTVDGAPQCLELRKVLDYLNNRYIIDEGMSISITWDTARLSEWLLRQSAPVAAVNIQSGYLSYESVLDTGRFPEQKAVNFKQTIEEAILIPAITAANTNQSWEQRMNSLRDKYISRCLFVAEPQGVNADIADVRNTFGKLCSIGQLSEYLNIVVDGTQRLTFKGFSQPAHKLAMTVDSWGIGAGSLSAFYLPQVATLVDSTGKELSNYYSYLGASLETFVNKEVVIQYNGKSAALDANPSLASQLKLYMISQVLKQHDVASGVTTYVRI